MKRKVDFGLKGIPAGLSVTDMPPAATHEIKRAEMNIGGKIAKLELIRSLKYPEGLFLPAKVMRQDEKILWNFKDEQGFKGLAKLAEIDGDLCVFLEYGNKIERVISIYNLLHSTPVKVGGKIRMLGGKTVEQLLALKAAIAEAANFGYELAAEERAAITAKQEAERKRIAAEVAKEEAARKAKAEELARKREEAKKAILARKEISVFDQDTGQQYYGIPVVGSEYEKLAEKYVILVETYNQVTGEAGKPLEAFYIKREKGKSSKVKVRQSIGYKKPEFVSGKPVVEALGVLNLDLGPGYGGQQEVMHFASEGFRALKSAGLNGGTKVAVGNKSSDGSYTVFAFEGDEPKQLGAFKEA